MLGYKVELFLLKLFREKFLECLLFIWHYYSMKPSNIFLVQFRTDESVVHEQKSILRYLKIKKTQFKIINAFDGNINFSMPQKIINKTSKIILGGSGEFSFSENNKGSGQKKVFVKMIKRIKPFIQYLLRKDIPTLGICFGHQLLGYNLGVEIIASKPQQEVGSFSISLTQEGKSDSLFSNLPPKFFAQLGHKDSLKDLPEKSILLAKSKKCKIQSFRYKENIYGVQFHPELTLQGVVLKLKLYPSYTSKKSINKIIENLKSSPHSSKILKNFKIL